MPGTLPDSPLPKIEKASNPRYPQFVFEWHPWTQKVYVVHVPGEWIDGVFIAESSYTRTARAIALAEHCEHHARFLGFVQTYLRGYAKGAEDRNVGTT